MTYIWVAGKNQQRMHIQQYRRDGTPLSAALCGIKHPFDRSINAPWSLGKGVCKHCLSLAQAEG